MIAPNKQQKIRLVRDIEEHGQNAGNERDDEKLPHVERAERIGDRNRRERNCASCVPEDEERATPETIDPYSCGQREDEEGKLFEDRQSSDRERARVEDLDRGDRQREERDL